MSIAIFCTLLRLSSDLTFTSAVQPIKLPGGNSSGEVGEATVIGWGGLRAWVGGDTTKR